jgi:serine phosphatase RsbU (regulator of sigma subunit)
MEIWGGNEATDTLVRTSGLDAYAYSQPYGGDLSGGDVLYLTSCSSGRISRVLLADVVGHGKPAGEAALRLRQLMAGSVDIYNQTKLVKALNEEFSGLQELGRFASAVVASYFRPTGALTICNAGHPPPIYFSARSQAWRMWSSVASEDRVPAPSNLPLGMFRSVEYDLMTAHFEPGDLLLLYTDGVIEASDEEGDQLGTSGLLQILQGLEISDTVGIVPGVLQGLYGWTGAGANEDDISLMLIARNDLKGSLRDEVLAPVRHLRHRISGGR